LRVDSNPAVDVDIVECNTSSLGAVIIAGSGVISGAAAGIGRDVFAD
jgi:hypothetical protein